MNHFPRVLVARNVERDGSYYAGPFMPASLARRTMGLTHRLFGIRSCNEVITGNRERPCLEYDIKRCIAPCVAAICSQEQYAAAVEHTLLFFEGQERRTARPADGSSMAEAAAAERFEEAAHLRDAARTVQTLRDRQQKIATVRMGDRDAFGLHMGPAGAVVHVFVMRERKGTRARGARGERGHFRIGGGDSAGVGRAVLRRSPGSSRGAPVERRRKTSSCSRHGSRIERAGACRWWCRSAETSAASSISPCATRASRTRRGSSTPVCRNTMRSRRCARRWRCRRFRGASSASTSRRFKAARRSPSMVVCEDGKMRKSDYRKYRISPANHAGSDDFAAMNEVVTRRYRKLLEQGGPFPDLILIDGGKGQLSAAYDALRQLGLANLIAVGIAKKEELIYTRDREEPIVFEKDDPALRLVQQIRDEAHRFAVTFHRKARIDARPAVGARQRSGRRAAPAQGAARCVRQSRGCAARVQGRADERGRRKNRRCRARILRRERAVARYTL